MTEPASPGTHHLRRALLAPHSVALLGASGDPEKTSSRPLSYLKAAGWPGTVYPVNPSRDAVLGHRAWPSLRSLPEVPDHVLVMTGAELAVEAIRDCAAIGVPVATVMASGFAEAGPAGVELQRQLLDAMHGSRLRLLGPSSLGVVNVHDRLVLTANAAFTEPDLPTGEVFVASQSGSVIGALLSRGAQMGVGFAGFVSTGGELDLSLGEVCSATLDDPRVGSYALFLESLPRTGELRRFAVEAAALGRPVVAYKIGRSRAAADLALSHTGVLAGDDRTASAVLADLGIGRVSTFDALLESQPLVRRLPAPKPSAAVPRIGVVTTTGGGAAMAIDQLAVRGAVVQSPGVAARQRLRDMGIEVGDSPLVDLTLAGTRYEVMKATLDVMLTSDDFDLVLAVVGSSARFHPDLAIRPIVDSAGTGTPLAAFVVPEAPEALRLLRTRGVPAFRTPESCADALTAALRRRPARNRAGPRRVPAHTGVLTEYAAYGVLDRLGVPRVDAAPADVATPPAELPFPGPVAVKALASELPHKSDIGGVVLDVTDADELRRAVRTIADNVRRAAPHIELTQCLVQPMVAGLAEFLVGYRLGPDAEPVVVLAAGGVSAELLGDRSVRVAPVDLETAHEMVREVGFHRLLEGHRGRPAGDLDALAEVVVAISHAGDLDDIAVAEAEVNPLIVLPRGEGVLAVDALVVAGVRGTDTTAGR